MSPYHLAPGTRVRSRIHVSCEPGCGSVEPGDLGTVLTTYAPSLLVMAVCGRRLGGWAYSVRFDGDLTPVEPGDDGGLHMTRAEVEPVD